MAKYIDQCINDFSKRIMKEMQLYMGQRYPPYINCHGIECTRHKDGWVCDWLDVRNLIKYDRLITTYKINNGLCPENLKNRFTPRSNISRYNTRKIDDFEIPRVGTAKSLLDTREQVPETRSQSKYETLPH